MASEKPIAGGSISLTAGATLATKQYYFVKLSADNTCIVCAAATDVPIGVVQNAPASGETAEVVVVGLTKVNADAALTYGNLIGTAADGQADAKTAGSDTTEYVCGQVVTGTGAAGGLASAFINCANLNRGA